MENYSQAWQVIRYEREKKSNFFCFLPHTIFAKAFLFNVGGYFYEFRPVDLMMEIEREGERDGTRVSGVRSMPRCPYFVWKRRKNV